MVDTAGNKLRRARQGRHLTLEDAARVTKIRAHQLADLEADEYSNFANLAYARSYLANYAKYLRVDLRAYLEGFSDGGGGFALDDYQYLSDKPVGVYRIPYRRGPRRVRRPQRQQLIGAALGLAALCLAVFGWMLYVNVQRLGDLDKLAARQEAREKAGRENPASAGPSEAATATAVRAPGATPAVVALPPAGAPANPLTVDPVNPLMADPVNPLTTDPAKTLPVSAPTADTPAPSAAPANAPAQVSIPALATAAAPDASEPVLPLSGDGRAVRELLTAHAAQPQPQKVVNDRPRGQ